jgi:PKD repeat protein
LTNAAYPREVTDHHEIELQGSGPSPGDCSSGGLVPAGDITVSPANPVVNQTVCFNGITAFPTAVDFTWDFNGDGKADATGANACTTFNSAATFQVTLLARTLDHDCGTATAVVTVGPGTPATCSIVVSPSQILLGDTANFTAITADPDGRVRRFVWNFGDGKTASSSRNTITHKYERAGAFAVVLTITDDQGNVSTCQTSVTVTEEQQGAPVCAFTVSPTNIIAGSSVVSANASASTDSDGTIDQYVVDWGDGTFDTLSCPGGTCPTPTGLPIISKSGAGTYATEGTFTVTLVVRDNDGLTSTCTQQVTVCPAGGCNQTITQCSNGIDDDGDTFIDLLDPQCTGPSDDNETS